MKYTITILTLSFIISTLSARDHSKIFKESIIESETQIFDIHESVKIDSLIFKTFSSKIDTVEITLLSDKNCFKELLDPKELYKDTLIIEKVGIVYNKLSFSNIDIILSREELHFKFNSISKNSNLITKTSANHIKCDSIIIDRNQYFETKDKIVYGKSNYEVDLFYSNVDKNDDINYSQIDNYIDSSITISSDANLVTTDINKDGYPDLILDGKILINNKMGYLYEQLSLWKTSEALYYAYDLNNDGNIEIIRIGNDKQIEFKTLNENLEILNQKKTFISELDWKDIKEVIFFDYNNDRLFDLVLNTKTKLQILINQFPSFYLKELELNDNNFHIKNDLLSNKLIVYNSDEDINSPKVEFIKFRNYKYGITEIDNDINTEIVFDNNNGFENDNFIIERNGIKKGSIKRRLLTPEKYYLTDLESNGKNEFIITNNCECEPNNILNINKTKVTNISEKTDLKFINLSNALFVDLDKNGFKELITIENEQVKVYKQQIQLSEESKLLTTNSNEIQFINNSNKINKSKSSINYYGKNQSYGLIDITDEELNSGDTVIIDGEVYKYENSDYKLIENIEEETTQLIIGPNPFSEKVKFISKNNKIKLINIFDQNGKIIFSRNVASKSFDWLGEDDRKVEIPQGVYYYEVKLSNILNPIKGRIMKVKK